jgi:uncharacterized LabA/DUF88 family protein
VSDRVVVFIDYQNIYQAARRAFHDPHSPHWQGQFDPVKLAEHLAADSPFDRELSQVRVYRGQPDRRRDARGYAANLRQLRAWTSSPLVEVTSRTLRYPHGWPQANAGERPQEKGIDVALAIDFVAMAFRAEYEVGIMVSTDTDLVPALEFVSKLTNAGGAPRAEVAAWSGTNQRSHRLVARTRSIFCHWVSVDHYCRVADQTNYGAA